MKILIAEDEPAFRRILQTILTEWGYEVQLAADGAEAYRVLLAPDAPKLAILDWKMPGMEGVEICRRIREELPEHYAYLILLTSLQRDEDLIAGMDAGADDYIVKPFKHNELRVRLRAGRRILELHEELDAARAVLQEKATHDSLTGLFNREEILGTLDRELARFERDGVCFSIIMADIDHFKKINDNYGHIAGDEVLRIASRKMQSVMRPYDSIGRYGGEEFLIVLPECCGECAEAFAARLCTGIGGESMDTAEGMLPVTISLGVASSDRVGRGSGNFLLQAADAALYRAKAKGRNRVEVASADAHTDGGVPPARPHSWLHPDAALAPAGNGHKTEPAPYAAAAELRGRLAALEIAALESGHLEREIQGAREYAEDIVETVREPLVVLTSELKVLTANLSFYDTFQVRPEQTIGNFIYDLGNRQWDIPRLRVLLEEILPKDSVFNGYEVEHEFLDIGRKTMLLNARQIFRQDIGSHIILLAMEDITERKRAAAALQVSEKKFSDIFHSVPSMITISTLRDGVFIDVNQTTLETLGYAREEMIGTSAAELGLWEDESQHDKVIQTLQDGGAVRNLEVRLKLKGGPVLTGLFSAKLIDIDGNWRMLSIVRDISERKRAEEEIKRLNLESAERAAELETLNKELEAFDYTVAHDLRQPLNLLNSYCQVITQLCGSQMQQECRGYLTDAYNVTLRMNGLIEALLNFSRMGQVEPHLSSVDLSQMAREVAGSLQQAEPERQVEFRIAEGIVADCDASLLQAVFDNLLGNAWKYTSLQEQAVIEFGVREIDRVPIYYIRDNGGGFDMTDAEKLFFPFQRLPGAETSRGFGIGLATVERIIRRHGGKVWAESELDKGATFYFTLSGG
jgi:two-component system, cell cycle response regulator